MIRYPPSPLGEPSPCIEDRPDTALLKPNPTEDIPLADWSSFHSLDKPLPSPGLWGRVSVTVARARYHSKKQYWAPLRRRLPRSGWRTTVSAGAGVAIVVLIINVILLAWASTKPWDAATGTRVISEDDCSWSQGFFNWSHILINALSSILLAASNAAMQCLSAPTREAIDRAHAQGDWLDVGVSGTRNWRGMDRWRKWCWMLLTISSIPLHLLYNSAIFTTTSANEYYALPVSSNNLHGTPINVTTGGAPFTGPSAALLSNLTSWASSGLLERKSNYDCIQTYSSKLVNTYSNVLLVTSNNSNITLEHYFHHYPTPQEGASGNVVPVADWICGGDDTSPICDFSFWLQHSQEWNMTIGQNFQTNIYSDAIFNIDYCLLQETAPQCTVQLIPELMIVVIVANALKVVCFLAAVRMHGFRPLITLGDALASFVENPDQHTEGFGPLSATDIREAVMRIRYSNILYGKQSPYHRIGAVNPSDDDKVVSRLPLRFEPWKKRKSRWFSGASGLRWGITYALIMFIWGIGWVGVALFTIADQKNDTTFGSELSLGVGQVSPSALVEVTAPLQILGNILVANVPQLILSLAYFSYNGLFTSILLSREFTLFAKQRSGLRVSIPNGPYQRSSYWLSLPYRFSLPLLIFSFILHWAVSQAIFLAEIKVLDPYGQRDLARSVSCLGYSLPGFFIAMLLGLIMMLVPAGLGWIRYDANSPLPESNSLAISAACHPAEVHQGSSQLLFKYGVQSAEDRECVGISSYHVSPLRSECKYSTHTDLDQRTIQELSGSCIMRRLSWRVLNICLAVLSLAKLVCLVMIYMVSFAHQISSSFQEQVWYPYDDRLQVATLCFASVSLGYVIVRIATDIIRWRKKWALRYFAWHVASEAFSWLVWVAIFVSALVDYLIELEEIRRAGGGDGSTSGDLRYAEYYPRANPQMILSAILMATWAISTMIECRLWWEQSRPKAPRLFLALRRKLYDLADRYG